MIRTCKNCRNQMAHIRTELDYVTFRCPCCTRTDRIHLPGAGKPEEPPTVPTASPEPEPSPEPSPEPEPTLYLVLGSEDPPIEPAENPDASN